MYRQKTIILFILLTFSFHCKAISRFDIDSVINAKAKVIPALNDKVNMSLSEVPLDELIRAVANGTGVNIHINNKLPQIVSNNFDNVMVKDVLIYLVTYYDLDIGFIGNIITISKEPERAIDYSDNIKWDEERQMLFLDVKNLPVEVVIREITRATKKNTIKDSKVTDKNITSYIEWMPFDAALDKMAYANGLKTQKTNDGFYILELSEEKEENTAQPEVATNSSRRRVDTRSSRSRDNNQQDDEQQNTESKLEIKMLSRGMISILADNAPLQQIVKEICQDLNKDYIFIEPLEENKTLRFDNISLDDLLHELFSESLYTYTLQDDIYFFRSKAKYTAIIPLEYRPIHGVVDTLLPQYMKEDIEFKHYNELNSLIVTGPKDRVDQIEKYIKTVDKPIPVVLIEVAIISISESFTVSTGIQMGLGSEPTSTGGSLLPGIDFSIGAGQLTNILQDIGFKNIGNLTPNFYLILDALETQGYLDVQSTPTLSTLNGHQASLSVGEEQYYLEERTDVVGTQNPQLTTTQSYKSVTADLSIDITPIISANEYVTLDIKVVQNDFTDRISETAPPGSVIREFNSKIRVKNQETIMLGGLEEKRNSDSGTGTPILSRIPIIKWFFSSRSKEDSKSKLTVLIKPTIIN